MKKILSNYYAIIMMLLFIIYNLILMNLKIGGLLYQMFMIFIIVCNIAILIKLRKNIKHNSVVIIIYFFIWLFSKNALQCAFGLSSMITLMITGFMDSWLIKIITVLITIFFTSFSMTILMIYLFTFGPSISEESGRNDIYNDMHYYCEDNYEVYSYSAGAMDRFHYSIDKHYDFLNIDGIIYISYNERNEVGKNEYNEYLNTHKCKLTGDINGSK